MAPPAATETPAPRLLPFVLAVLAFAPGLGGGFAIDDPRAIAKHPAVNGTAPAWRAFALTFWGDPPHVPPPSYRPLATLSFALDRALFGLSPAWMHLTSLGYYLALLALARRLALRWLDPRAAAVALCLFAVSPLHAENVASLVGRADVLALGLSVASLLCVAPRDGAAPPGRVALGVAAYVAALGCKESAATLPALAAALLAFTAPRERWRRALAPALALAAAGVAYAVARRAFMPASFGGAVAPDDVTAGAGAWERALYALELLARYARLAVAPADLCAGRRYAEVWLPTPAPGPRALAGAALLAAAAWRTARDWRLREPPWALCALAAWWIFSTVPFAVPEAMADRFMLAPSLFAALALAAPLARWARAGGARLALVAAAVLMQAGAAAFYASRWRDDASVLAHAVTACPSSVNNHMRYAELLAHAGNHGEAAWHYAVASEGRRHFPREWRHPAADEELTLPLAERLARMHSLLRVEMPEPAWRAGLAAFLMRAGRVEEARRHGHGAPLRSAARQRGRCAASAGGATNSWGGRTGAPHDTG